MNCEIKARDWIRGRNLVRNGSSVLAAVSGGPDSMAMLSILDSLKGELGIRLSAAHLDHGIRPESAGERRLVEAACGRLGIPLVAGTADVPGRSRAEGVGIEEAAREERYRFLEEAARQAGADRVALGHNRDDQVETILHHIIRGSGWRGLAGMPARRGIFIRPVLDCPGDDLRRYCREKRIRYAVDRSNLDTSFLRNRIRRELLPLLRRDYNPSIDEAVLRLGRNIEEGREALEEGIGDIVPEAGPDGAVELPISALEGLSRFYLYLLVDSVLRERFGVHRDIGRTHYEAVVSLAKPGRSGRRTALPHGIEVIRTQDAIRLSAEGTGAGLIDETLLIPGDGRYLYGGSIGIEVERGPAEPPFESGAERARLGGLKFPLLVRRRRPGDRLVPFGMKGRKKLSDLMIDGRVPVHLRDEIPVIEDARGIVWVPGVVSAERTRIGPRTREMTTITVLPDGRAGLDGIK